LTAELFFAIELYVALVAALVVWIDDPRPI
jgi:hypothetical protein